MNLHDLGLRCGAGKAAHNYLRYFQSYLEPRRGEPLTMLEIGIEAGGSIRMWEQYLPNATIYGIDSEAQWIRKFDRATALLADQNNRESLLNAVGHLRFDLIVDDGGHRMTQQITSLNTLWPLLKEEGLYIIEDLHTSWQPNLYGGPPTTIEHLKGMLDTMNYRGRLQFSKAVTQAELDGLNEMEKSLEFMHFYPYLVVIKKWSILRDTVLR